MHLIQEDDSTVGTVISIVNNGSCDLLEVMPGSSEENPSITISEFETSGSFILIPFVKEIVPDIDMNKRVIQITPPKGLLELNSRSDSKTKKERSLLVWFFNLYIVNFSLLAFFNRFTLSIHFNLINFSSS